MMPVSKKSIEYKSQWTSVKEVPELPFESFKELMGLVSSDQCGIGIDYATATAFPTLARTPLGPLGDAGLVAAAWLPSVLSLALAIWQKTYLALLGVPLCIFSIYISNPLGPERKIVTILGMVMAVTASILTFNGNYLFAWLSACLAIPFIFVRLYYFLRLMALRMVIHDSEELFLYLFEHRYCTVMDKRSGKIYSFRPDFAK